jgi:hypothetical protein
MNRRMDRYVDGCTARNGFVDRCMKAVLAFIRRFCQILLLPIICRESGHAVFASLDFARIIFLNSKVFILPSNSQPGGPGLCIYVQ